MAAQEERHDTIRWSSAATRRRASHPLPLIVSRELGAVQRTQRGPSLVVARSPRASGPAASDRTARERRLGCCGERRVGPQSARAPSGTTILSTVRPHGVVCMQHTRRMDSLSL